MELISEEKIGTSVGVILKKSPAPSWFVEDIELRERVVVVDDDQSIHEIWKQRIPNEKLIHFSTGELFEECLKIRDLNQRTIFLFDQEFINQSHSGLDLIKMHNLSSDSILVTSRYDDSDVRAKALLLGVKILPKGLSPWVPLSLPLDS